MISGRIWSRLAPTTVLLLLLAFSLTGCTAGGNLVELSGRSFTASSLSLGANKGELVVRTSASNNTATGTLKITAPNRSAQARTRLVIASAKCNGTYDASS